MEKDRSKKIAIITFHQAYNYGAVLQAYALQQTLSTKYDACILDYRCKKIDNDYKTTHPQNIKQVVSRVIFHKFHSDTKKRKIAFDTFSQELLNKSSVFNEQNIIQANQLFDAFITGSDQVWNLDITGNDWNYFLSFAENNKRFSYAASFGNTLGISESNRMQIKNELLKFRAVRVREKNGADYIQTLSDELSPCLTCDPVFLLSSNDWNNIIPRNRIINGDYIFVYIVAQDTYAIDFAMNLAKRENLKIVICQLNKGRYGYLKNTISGMDAGPIEFIGLIKNAKYIVTTSFHAMAFSLIFNKEFYYELDHNGTNNNSRLVSLAELFQVQNREITSALFKSEKSDWKKINNTLIKYSENSKQILFSDMDMV